MTAICLTAICLCGIVSHMRPDLEKARLAKGLTQGQLADLIGRGQSDISRYESGEAGISVELAPKIADALGISVLEVLYPGQAAAKSPLANKRARHATKRAA